MNDARPDAPKISPAVIVITGMHRSGTSLIASAFQLAGLHIGDRLLGRAPGNRHGHFEDLDFQRFHERVLERVGKNHLTVTPGDVREMTPEDVERAKVLIDRRSDRRLWGWKDPRTCVFLDFWHARLTNPRYVFVYRHPIEVVLSMFRRRMELEISEVVTDPLTALDAWRVHNQAILDFYGRHRDRCVLGHIGALAGDLAGAVTLCAGKFGLDLVTDGVSALYHRAELGQPVIPDEALAEFRELAPLVAALYTQMELAADLPEPRPVRLPGAGGGVASLARRAEVPSAAEDHARERPDTLGQEVELLLGRVAPRAVMTGKWALDELRLRQLDDAATRQKSLETQRHTLEAQVTALDARVAELAGQIAGLRTQLGMVEHERARLETRLEETQQRFLEAATRAAAAEARAAAAEARAAAAEARADELARVGAERAAQCSELAQAITDKDRLLAAMAGTRAWRAAQKWYAFKRAGLRLLGRAD